MNRWLRFRAKGKFEREMGEELRFHIETQTAANIAAGMTPEEARRQARLQLGAVEGVKEDCREERRGFWLEALWVDARHGLRLLRKDPGFTAVAVLTLALGVGANSAIFSVVESQLWRPLPFPDSERVYAVDTRPPANPTQWFGVGGPEFLEWRRQIHAFDRLGGYTYPTGRNFSTGGTTGRAYAMRITAGFFETLQIQPALGRAFRSEDDMAGREQVAIISHGLWRDAFGSDPNAIGKTLILDSVPHQIIGVTPAGMRLEFTQEPDLFVPIRVDLAAAGRLSNDNFSVVGHLAPGVTEEEARAEMTAMVAREVAAEGDHATKRVLVLEKQRVAQTGYAALPLLFFGGAVGLVLLIACVNVASLLLAQGLTRRREFAMRAALGARRSTLIRQQVVESLILALLGGTAGILLSVWGARAFTVLIPQGSLPRSGQIDLDMRVALFTLAASVLSAVAIGVVPALFAARVDSSDVLRQGGRSFAGSYAQHRTRSILVIVEVTFALVLVFGAGLFLGSYIKLQQAPLGFDPHGILTMRIMLRGQDYMTSDLQTLHSRQITQFYERSASAVRSLPGVRLVSVSGGIPLLGGGAKSFTIAGQPAPHAGEEPEASIFNVSPEFFALFRMHFLSGRAFDAGDDAAAPRVAIVNQNFARRFFPGGDAVGKVLNLLPGGYGPIVDPGAVQIVGVVENAQEYGANEMPFDDLYLPFGQSPSGKAIVSVSSDLPASSLMPSIRQAIAGIDKDQPLYDVETMDERVANSVEDGKFNLYLVASLASVALVLVSVGIFGTISYFAQQRTQEFGIRVALGASPLRILRHALGQSLAMGVAGLALGIAVTLGLGLLLRHALYLAPHEHEGMLYGVSVYDPITMIAASALLICVIALASYIPARRAMRVDPMVALRYE